MVKDGAKIYVPDGKNETEALARTTRMCIAAHQDDAEFMAYHGIISCFNTNEEWFTAVIVTNGAGSPRSGAYANYSDNEIQLERRKEQKKAAVIGEYGALALLNHTSTDAKDAQNTDIIQELAQLIRLASPKIIYTHNIADKHDTHVSVALKTIAAVRSIPKNERPQKLYGCEVWRSLDWLDDVHKIRFDVTAHPNIADALFGVFDSQIFGGKQYNAAVRGRWAANAVFADAREINKAELESYAMDLTPIIEDDGLDIRCFLKDHLGRFVTDIVKKLDKYIYL